MSANAATLFAEQFSTNVQLLLQQKGSRLRQAVMGGAHVGSQASPVDQIGTVAAQRVTSRFAAMGRVDATLDRRWVFPVDYDLPQLFDTFDKLRVISDPASRYVENAVYAMGRAQDAEILTAFFASAKTGVNGGTSTSFTSGNVIGVNTGGSKTKLNVAKLRAAKLIAMQNEIDLDNDPLYCAIAAADHDALLNEIQVISLDFNDRPVLVQGKVTQFLGINLIHTELVSAGQGADDQTTTSNPLPFWAKSGMYLGEWEAINATVSQRADLQGLPWQAYVKGTFGGARLDEKKVFKIWSYISG